MAITIRSAQTISNGVTLRGNNTQFITPNPLPVLFELDASIYASGTTWLDQSGNNRHATKYGSPTWSSEAGGCFTIANDGDSYFEIAGSESGWGIRDVAPNATFSVWAKLSVLPGNYQQIAGWRNNNFNYYFLLLNNGTNTEARVDGGASADIGMDYTPYYNNWTFITFATNPTTSSLYLNGTLVGTSDFIAGNQWSGNALFEIGHSSATGFSMNGKIGGVMAYSREITQLEVTAEFNRTKTRYGL